ncbi:SRPBCC domain-containing protein [Thalassospira sp. UBA1131]|uniref:SRPBCC domain-containing protein n=1 Tax=Thalassospira sp. UBA1131 TaxID=1947672 RepID=UPI0025EFFD79|nr:SRPBCC domain-containing protein [Thalassospira sp. UBA1131]
MTPLKNPDLAPIRFELTLAVDPDDAFNAFTAGFGDWWPTDTHSISKKDCITVEFNDGVGGEIIERAKGQDDIPWGRVRSWQPGEHLSFTWHPGWNAGDFTLVEVSFDLNEFGRCVIRLEHKAWENVGEIAPALREGYLKGWEFAFGECFGNYLRQKR